MTVEKNDTIENLKGDAEIDKSMEIRTVQYLYRDLAAGNIAGVISQPQIVRYFEEQNPALVVKKVYSFVNSPQALTVTIKMKVTKKKVPILGAPIDTSSRTHTIGVDKVAEGGDKTAVSPAKMHVAGKDSIIESQESTDSVSGERRSDAVFGISYWLDKSSPTEPITDPAKLLETGPITEAADHDVIDGKDARLEEQSLRIIGLNHKLDIANLQLQDKDARIKELEKQVDSLKIVNDRKYEKICRLVTGKNKFEKENIILKKAIKKFGNSDDFDWNVLGRIDGLETTIRQAIDCLPESPDSAKDCLVYAMGSPDAGEQETGGENNE